MIKNSIEWKPTKREAKDGFTGFEVEVSNEFIFFYGGGTEGAIPKRLLPNLINFLSNHWEHWE